MQVTYKAAATKALRKMPKKDAAALMDKLNSFAATGEGDVKKLVASPYYRLRHRDWRAIFEIEDDILVVRVAHRREVYD